MGTHPSRKFEDGVLVERAISSEVAGDPDEQDATATKPYRAPEPVRVRLGAKRVESAENKAVKKAAKK